MEDLEKLDSSEIDQRISLSGIGCSTVHLMIEKPITGVIIKAANELKRMDVKPINGNYSVTMPMSAYKLLVQELKEKPSNLIIRNITLLLDVDSL
jgi:hypothetical protein